MTGDGKKRLEVCWRYFNPPPRLAKASFGTYTPQTKAQQAALQTCKEYGLMDIKQGKGLFLFGLFGTGKTHLAVATVRNLMEASPDLFGARQDESSMIYYPDQEDYRGLYCSFFSVVELLDLWKPGSDSKRKLGDWLFYRAKTDDLVVLDDLGAEKASEWTGDRLYAVVDARYRNQKATIFTTNCSEKELVDNGYGRIVSRIFEMTEQVPVMGPDYRRKMA